MYFCLSRRSSRFNLNFFIVLMILAFNLHIMGLKFAPDSRAGGERLVFVACVHRHGDRAPGAPYPNDPYANYSWPGGYGALSQKGALQLFNLGRQLRKRYRKLQSEDGLYTKDNLRVLSSYFERCIMSAESLLAGFFPPDKCENLLPIPWQPIAVNVIPPKEDYMLFQLSAPCPKYDAIFGKYLTEPDPESDFYRFNQSQEELYKYLSEATRSNVSGIQQVTLIQDSLSIEHDNGFKLPAWSVPVFPEKLQKVKKRGFILFTETPYMTRIRSGPWLTDVYQQMEQKQIGNLTRNIALYSAHDSTLSAIMKGLGVSNQTTYTPKYGAALCLELHCGGGAECTVKALYDFDTYKNRPKLLNIPGCPNPCRLDTFKNAISANLISNITEACQP